jgi:hypothetical protein
MKARRKAGLFHLSWVALMGATRMRSLIFCLLLTPAVQAEDLDAATAAVCPGLAAWVHQHRTAAKSIAQPADTGTDAALTAQLHNMAAEDQQARQAWITAGMSHPDPIVFNHVQVVDLRNVQALHHMIDAGGIPTQRRVGRDGLHDFWLLVQHADTDVPLQEQVLKAFSRDDSGVPRADLALLTDRVRDHQGRPQLYGTQFHFSGNEMAPAPIEDEAHVDERRAAMDLPPLADYACGLRVVYKFAPAK